MTGPRVARAAELDTTTLYALLRLRVDVFVVEQQCPYGELDGRDLEPGTRHVWSEDAGGVTGYLRVLDEAGDEAADAAGTARIGRVCTRVDRRGDGLAARLLAAALDQLAGRVVVLDAQSHLAGWYARAGFDVSGPEFVEDGIPHVPMRRTPIHRV